MREGVVCLCLVVVLVVFGRMVVVDFGEVIVGDKGIILECSKFVRWCEDVFIEFFFVVVSYMLMFEIMWCFS